MTLDRAALLAGSAQTLSLETRDVDVAEFGGKVRLRALASGERDDFAIWAVSLEAAEGPLGAYLTSMRRLVLISLVNPDGSRMFDENDADDVDLVKGLEGEGYSKLRLAARELNRLSRDGDEPQGENSPLADSAET